MGGGADRAFIFALGFHRNYDAILYRLRDIATYWSEIPTFLYRACIRPRRGLPRRNFVKTFDRMIGLP